MSTVVLNVKIDEVLKEQLRHYAEVHKETLSAATQRLLQLAFEVASEAEISEDKVDSQHTEEESLPITSKEIKVLRKILKKRK